MNTPLKRKADFVRKAIDPSEFSRKLSSNLASRLENILGSGIASETLQKIIEMTVTATLDQIFPTRRECTKERNNARSRTVKKLAATKFLAALPIEDLKPNAVIEQGLIEMSLSQLYRAARDGRFYCSMPRGRSNGRLFPAWQFVKPVPEILPEVLRVLEEKGERYVHARMVTAEDELNELSPAEVLAGRAFAPRVELDEDQIALLKLPSAERLALVKEVFEEPSREHAIG